MQVRVAVQVGDLSLINSEVELLEVREALGDHSRCVVEFIRDRSTDLRLEVLLGSPLKVILTDEAGSSTAFDGEVVGGSQEHFLHAGSRFRIHGASRSLAWDQHVTTAVFPAAGLADIVRRFGGTTSGAVQGSGPLTLVQNGESDFAFVRRLAAEHGCFVRPSASAFEVRSSFDAVVAEMTWGRTLTRARAVASVLNPGFKGAAAQDNEFRDHRLHGVRKHPAPLGGASKLTQVVKRLGTKAAGAGDPGYLGDQRRAPTLAAFRAMAERYSEAKAAEALTVDGSSVEIRMRAGAQCTLSASESFDLPTDGTFGIVSVVHRFTEQLYANDFVLTPFACFAPIAAPVPLAHGVVTAVVTHNDDPEGRGRVRVRFAWMDAAEKSRWIPLVVPYAGNNRGVQWIPEVGDHVAVAFEQGDAERPLVLGGMWNGKAKASQQKNIKRIVSRLGHSVVFDDRDGKESIEIFSANGACLVALHNPGTPTLTIHSEGDVSIEAKGQLRIKAGSLVEQIDGASYRESGADAASIAKGKLVLGGGTDVLIDAGMNARLGAGMTAEVHGGATAQVIGGLVQIQPPGGPRTQKGRASAPRVPKSVWQSHAAPEKAEGKTSSDKPTPRTSGGRK